MRDIAVFLIVMGTIPMIFSRPYIGIIVWSWLGYMNPHRLSWGFAYDFPFAQLVAVVTILALFFSKEPKRFPITGTVVLWLLFILWMNLTTVFALNPESAFGEWDRSMKIQFFSFLTLILMRSRFRLDALIWTIVLSVGFFGVKGGVFSITTGGKYMVFGPPGTFIEGNNSLALALIMILPLMWYLFLISEKRYIRWGLIAAIALTSLSVLTSHSRGAFLGIVAMMCYLALKTPKKWLFLPVIVLGLPALILMMPESWHERMWSIAEYEQDGSAMGRINAWYFAYNIAMERPLVGGGYNVFTPGLFLRYAPEPEDFHDAHSVYFEVLAEHGFVGLTLFLLLGVSTMLTARWVNRKTKKVPNLLWAHRLSGMLQVGLVGYAVTGAFLGLAYFDLLYHFVAITVLLKLIVSEELLAGTNEQLRPTAAYGSSRYAL